MKLKKIPITPNWKLYITMQLVKRKLKKNQKLILKIIKGSFNTTWKKSK